MRKLSGGHHERLSELAAVKQANRESPRLTRQRRSDSPQSTMHLAQAGSSISFTLIDRWVFHARSLSYHIVMTRCF
jgi:hypothetical protein